VLGEGNYFFFAVFFAGFFAAFFFVAAMSIHPLSLRTPATENAET
jgi:hypothetical protein